MFFYRVYAIVCLKMFLVGSINNVVILYYINVTPLSEKSEIFDVCVMVLCGNHATLASGVCPSFCIITAFRRARVAQW